MGALYAQGLPWDQAHRKVRMYASRMSSVRHLLQVCPLLIQHIVETA